MECHVDLVRRETIGWSARRMRCHVRRGYGGAALPVLAESQQNKFTLITDKETHELQTTLNTSLLNVNCSLSKRSKLCIGVPMY